MFVLILAWALQQCSATALPVITVYSMDERTEQNLIVRSVKSVTIIKDGARGIVLLKLTTDRHEASRGLTATAELLVVSYCIVDLLVMC